MTTKLSLLDSLLTSYQKRNYFEYNTPFTCTFLVTNRCNLQCAHCFNSWNDSFDELLLEEYEYISKSMGFFPSALFCGGEPFLRGDLPKIINAFRKNCFLQWASTTTNGQLCDSIISQLDEICFYAKHRKFVINFSLDGFKPQHDKIRGEGTFDKCINTIKEAKRLQAQYNNLDIAIVSAMSTINEEILPDFFIHLASTIKPKTINLLLVRQSPRAGKSIKDIDPNNYSKAVAVLVDLYGRDGDMLKDNPLSLLPFCFYKHIKQTLKTGKRDFLCYAGYHGMLMRPDGQVNACEILDDPNCTKFPQSIGNIRDYDYDFKRLWNSPESYRIRNRVNRSDCCFSCTHETEGLLPSVYFEPNSFWK